jgi:DNA adenine methylase
MKTFLRRPGNKTKHLKHIIPLIPEFEGTYYEPFLGTGAVYLHLLPEKAVLNDLNKDIINIWKLVKTEPEYVISKINEFKKVFLPLNNVEKLKMCKEIVSKMDTLKGKERTVKYLIMIYCSFNSCIYSGNKLYISGINGNLHSRNQCHIFSENYVKKLLELKHVLKNIRIENKDYKIILSKTKQGDFVFLDPPYIEEKSYLFNYNKNEKFSPPELKSQLKRLDDKKVKWIMTQIDTKQVRELFRGYRFICYSNDSNYRGSRSIKKEVIIMNY